jgi:large subunit ribosomal protein L19
MQRFPKEDTTMATSVLAKIADEQRKDSKVPAFRVGDSIKVHVKIKEGDKERVQVFAGTVIARDGTGHTETFTVRRVSYGEGVERIFPLYSPVLDKIELDRSGKTRRAKLYYLRKTGSKPVKLKEKARAVAAPAHAAAAKA